MEKKDIFRAGSIAKQVLMYGASLIKPGASYMHVYQCIIKKIHELGAIPAFPPQMALDAVAAHYLPMPGQDHIFSQELVSLDIGVCVNGAIGDTACTIDLSGKYAKLVEAAQAGLDAGLITIRVGATIGDVGAAIEQAIHKHGANPITNLCGHGLGEYLIHTPPTIPNVNTGSCVKLKPGMHFACEPFATTGVGRVFESTNPTIYSLRKKRPVRSLSAKKVLENIEKHGTLPFSIHDLITQGLSPGVCALGLKELMAQQILTAHPPLIEESHQPVAQAEHTIYIDEQGAVFVTTRDDF